MKSNYHFISGLPRAGSTLLAALLRQNPRFHAEMSSPVGALYSSLLSTMSPGNESFVHINDAQRKDILLGVFHNYYQSLTDKPVIFDSNRLWCSKLPALTQLFPDAKVVCCVRNVAWIMDSFENAFQRNPLQNSLMFNNESEANTLNSRIDTLAKWDRVVGYAFSALKEAFYGHYASQLLLVDYDLLVTSPEKTLNLVYQFLDEESFQHDFDNVSYSAQRFDENLGLPGLHSVQGPIKPRVRRSLLPPDLFEQYSAMNFWRDTSASAANVISVSEKVNQK